MMAVWTIHCFFFFMQRAVGTEMKFAIDQSQGIVCLSVFYLSTVYLSALPSVSLSVSLSVCPSVCIQK